jgi:8-oxo-dGTP pyrophosphatase MutT (NUDIX family)
MAFPWQVEKALRGLGSQMYTHGEFFGAAGAGILIRADDTGRFLLMHRSRHVNEPNTWGILGGAIEGGEDPRLAAEREAYEEAKAKDVRVEDEPFYTFAKGSFRFFNYLGHVPREFTPKMDWESQGYKWVHLDDLPRPLHPGVVAFLPALKQRYER